jgi:hypothetical protein
MYGQFASMEAAQKAEDTRKKMMNLNAARERREVIRKATAARAEALATGVSQGAQFGSGLQGGFGQIAGEANTGLLASKQNQILGNQMFDYNKQQAQGNMLTSLGSGMQSLGNSFVSNMDLYNRVWQNI